MEVVKSIGKTVEAQQLRLPRMIPHRLWVDSKVR